MMGSIYNHLHEQFRKTIAYKLVSHIITPLKILLKAADPKIINQHYK